ncbi:MAG: FHA domain-containing protein [Chloroflexota bacterium]
MKRVLQCCGLGLLALIGLLSIFVYPGHAQEDLSQLGQLKITGVNTDTFPSVELQVYGIDGQGNPVDFSTEEMFVSHGGVPADFVTYEGTRPVGTLTVFLIDAPTGISDHIPAIQDMIKQYATPGNMQEQVDAVAIYQIGPEGPDQILPPTQFHNAVANAFATPIQPEEGLTALIDSTLAMLDQMESLNPNPAMVESLVLISDGTDAVSTAESSEVTRRAADLGIPIHTVVVDNPDLIEAGRQLGRTYLSDVAVGSRGIAAALADSAGISAIWNRINSFRNQSLLRYTVLQPASGTIPVELSMVNNPDMRDTTEVTVSAASPSVVINLPFDSRAITVPALDEPIELRLSATVSWLDDLPRAVTSAKLFANGEFQADIPPDQLEDFTVPIGNLIYGDNNLEIEVTDEQDLTASSGPVIVTVSEGEMLVPEDLQPAGLPSWVPWALGLAVFAVLGFLIFWLTGRNRSGRRERRRPPTTQILNTDESSAAGGQQSGSYQPFLMAHLDVLESQSIMPAEVNLGDMEVKLGRSPSQVDVAFRDDITVSRYHAVLRLEGSHYRIYDAGSTSGTFVNERPVPEYGMELFDGDLINLGAVVLRYRQL